MSKPTHTDPPPPPLPNSNINNLFKANKFFRDARDARQLIRGLKPMQKSGIMVRDINDGNVSKC